MMTNQPPPVVAHPETGVPSRCSPFLVTTARRALVKRFVCRPDRLRLCPCYFDALLYARLYTDSCGKVCVVLRESDREVMARTGPKKQERDDADVDQPKKEEEVVG